jgi:hypothetical protein
MVTKFDFTNTQLAETYSFNTDDVPFTETFDIRVDDRNVIDREKMQDHGIWPTVPLQGGMSIDVAGDILSDSPENYITKRIAIARIFRGSGVAPTATKVGVVILGLSGQTEDWKTDVLIQQFSAPLKAGFVTYSPFMVTFFSFTPWFIGVTSGNKHYFS